MTTDLPSARPIDAIAVFEVGSSTGGGIILRDLLNASSKPPKGRSVGET